MWSSTVGAPQGRWLWSRNVDVLLIGGALFFPFAAIAIPFAFLVPGFGAALVSFFLAASLVVNNPHYAATYHLVVTEREKQPRVYKWLVGSVLVMIPVTIACVHWIDYTLLPVRRIYLTWTAWHYSAQHFGIAAMYAARNKRPMHDREKLPLQVAFVGVGIFMMMSLNLFNPPTTGPFSLSATESAYALSHFAWAYPLGLFVVGVSLVAAIVAHVRVKERTGKGLDAMAWLLFAVNFFWFVIPSLIVGKNNFWGHPEIALWFPCSLPFFHCIQYLGVTSHRARSMGDVKPLFLFGLLVVVGWLLFQGFSMGVTATSHVDAIRSFGLVVTLVNIHHFWIDGMMWKRPKKAPAPAVVAVPAKAGVLADAE